MVSGRHDDIVAALLRAEQRGKKEALMVCQAAATEWRKLGDTEKADAAELIASGLALRCYVARAIRARGEQKPDP